MVRFLKNRYDTFTHYFAAIRNFCFCLVPRHDHDILTIPLLPLCVSLSERGGERGREREREEKEGRKKSKA